MRWAAVFAFLLVSQPAFAQKEHGFDNRKPSGQPYLTPAETLQRMKVPPGFSVKLFASEPLMTNPIAMTIDDKGRVWIVESFEYPKRTPKGKAPRDRIVILEDTDGDGVADKRTVFAEGKDFPVTPERAAKGLGAFDMASGLEVGNGGCYVGAPPYLWHIQDTTGMGKADKFEIVASGFGSQDTHETLNTFTWGPDGWLYGLHGVFTVSKVKPGAAPGEQPVDLDAGVWRYHPRYKKFEVFAEGTSNPWGMDFNKDGECFLCCCVIPHLFHIVPGGIYIKQGGKPSYNQYAYGALKEISDHTFHKESGWAHAGLLCLDAAHMPKEYQNNVIFGSIHGCSIKRNTLKPNGSTYIGSRADDFLVSGDKNFRPIQMRWAPDGSILVSDWHDQNPCHQTNPDDWDYERGRIYRIVPPKPGNAVKASEMPFQLRTQTRLAMENPKKKPAASHFFTAAGFYTGDPDKVSPLDETNLRMNLIEYHSAIFNKCPEVARAGLQSQYESMRIWAMRTLADAGVFGLPQQNLLKQLVRTETSPKVLLEIAASLTRTTNTTSQLPVLEELFKKPALAQDPIIPFFLWLAVEKELGRNREGVLQAVQKHAAQNELLTRHIIPRTTRRIASSGQPDDISTVIRFVSAQRDAVVQTAALSGFAEALKGRQLKAPSEWHSFAETMRQKNNAELYRHVQTISASFRDPAAMARALTVASEREHPLSDRLAAIQQLALAQKIEAVPVFISLLTLPNEPPPVHIEAARALASFDQPQIAKDVLAQWKMFSQPVRAELVNTLRSRKPWAKALLEAIGQKIVNRNDLNDNVALAIRQFKDKELNTLLEKHYGVFRDSPAEIAALLTKLQKDVPAAPGDAVNGKTVFTKHCLPCHRFEGQGHEVGPNLDGAERSMDYILVNLIDPNRVVGTPYFSRTIVLKNGKLITGILAEEDATTLRLKRDNAVIEVIVKADIDEQSTSTKSLMPEGMTDNMTVQELRDLIRYLQPAAKK